jgi:small subunit ribosomal protein S8
MTNYPVGDFLIKIKNAVMADQKEVTAVSTNLIVSSAQALRRAGFLESVEIKDGLITVKIAFKNKAPLLYGLKLVSKPGLRIYMDVSEIGKRKKQSTLLISTPKGVLTSKEAVKNGVGGEIIVEVW